MTNSSVGFKLSPWMFCLPKEMVTPKPVQLPVLPPCRSRSVLRWACPCSRGPRRQKGKGFWEKSGKLRQMSLAASVTCYSITSGEGNVFVCTQCVVCVLWDCTYQSNNQSIFIYGARLKTTMVDQSAVQEVKIIIAEKWSLNNIAKSRESKHKTVHKQCNCNFNFCAICPMSCVCILFQADQECRVPPILGGESVTGRACIIDWQYSNLIPCKVNFHHVEITILKSLKGCNNIYPPITTGCVWSTWLLLLRKNLIVWGGRKWQVNLQSSSGLSLLSCVSPSLSQPLTLSPPPVPPSLFHLLMTSSLPPSFPPVAMQKMLSESCSVRLLQQASDSRRQSLVTEACRRSDVHSDRKSVV